MGSKLISQITATQTTFNDTDYFELEEAAGTSKKTTWASIKSNVGATPVGTIIESAAISAPTGWLSCNGAAVSRTTYSTLYEAITASLGTFTITSANPGVVSLSAHGLSTGSCIELTTTGTLPTNLSVNTNYYVIYVDANSFRLATSVANAIEGTAIDTSGGSQSGTHTLRHCPFGISGATNFLLPNRAAVVGVGAGSQTINTREKTAVLGLVQEDQFQGHDHNLWSMDSGSSNVVPIDATHAVGGGGDATPSYTNIVKTRRIMSGYAEDNVPNGTPRTGATTRENRIGMNYYIKY